MAQLKPKLPKEALAAIAGLQCPDLAWKRMEEIYGNRELSIMSTVKTLREFKSNKPAAHEQMIELATAVQKCKTELGNISAMNDLLGDRESLACIIQAMPAAVRDKWYDKDVPDDTIKKGEVLLEWVELQRQNAIKVRLDLMAAKMRTPTVNAHKAPAPQGDSTDRGLTSSSLHAHAGDQGSSQSKPKDTSAPKTGGNRVDVKTEQDAKLVAEKRKQNWIDVPSVAKPTRTSGPGRLLNLQSRLG